MDSSKISIEIGFKKIDRPLTIVSSEDAKVVTDLLHAAMKDETIVELTDAKGRAVILDGSSVTYVIVGKQEEHRMGFGGIEKV